MWIAAIVIVAGGIAGGVLLLGDGGSDGGVPAGQARSIDPGNVPEACDVLDPADVAAAFPALEPAGFGGRAQDVVEEPGSVRNCSFSWGRNGRLWIERFEDTTPGRTWEDFREARGDDGCDQVTVGVFDKGMICTDLFTGGRELFQFQEPIGGVGVFLELRLDDAPLDQAATDEGLKRVAQPLSDRATS
jgi:hypothetical protein